MAKGENPSTADSSGMNIPISSLHRFCIDAMVKSGLGSDDAKTVADVLTTNDAWGIYSHGTLSLRQYLKRVRGGGINARAQPLVMKEGPGWALVDADNALGMISSCHAMQTAMTKAGSQGIGYVGVRNSFHFGAAGYYANLATGKDMIGIAMSNTNANMAATGSSARVLGNNPIAYAVPAGEEKCIVLDIATSAAAGRKIAAAKSAGQKIPEGWLMDDEGMPSTDPSIWPDSGALMPMAGHKGFGLAVLVDVLSAVLTGAQVSRDVLSWSQADPSQPTGHGHAFIAIHISSFMPITEFKKQMDDMIRNIRSAPRARNVERIIMPGELELERFVGSQKEGMTLPENVIESLNGLAADTGLDFNRYLTNPED